MGISFTKDFCGNTQKLCLRKKIIPTKTKKTSKSLS